MESEERELRLTHEGYLTNSINLLLRDCALMRDLSHGKNPLLNQVIEELQPICNKALEELEKAPYRATSEEWNEYLKPMGLINREQSL
jgi:hypothetical protein